MYKMIFMGGYNSSICSTVARFESIQVVGYIVDSSISEDEKNELSSFFSEYKVPQLDISDIESRNPDIIFVCGYTKIIESDLLEKYLFVNIHAGVLPKWRGTSANSWAMINGEEIVGYSFHKVTDVLDGGDIFHIVTVELDENEKYGDARIRLNKILEQQLEQIFLEILSGKCIPVKQDNEKYVYCSKFMKKDGEILDWHQETQKLMGLFRVLGAPYGTGIFLFKKAKKYEIMEMQRDLMHLDAIGVSGAVILKKEEQVWVKTKDGAVIISQLKDEDGQIFPASQILNIGNRL